MIPIIEIEAIEALAKLVIGGVQTIKSGGEPTQEQMDAIQKIRQSAQADRKAAINEALAEGGQQQ